MNAIMLVVLAQYNSCLVQHTMRATGELKAIVPVTSLDWISNRERSPEPLGTIRGSSTFQPTLVSTETNTTGASEILMSLPYLLRDF